ncbi:MltA domain-containing protein [Caballeronia temeraria]|uniref:peptidoglycan lytic exotransglycosylase n=1 Tax=Caballeronia temeraria TaxID=1777137 RepID=A0A158C7A5_9BURK|nr:MltA domain-containing protein [Caballeronia temeraria]SAK78172.1 MltA domain-containing protein [Caballeronia temeraria]
MATPTRPLSNPCAATRLRTAFTTLAAFVAVALAGCAGTPPAPAARDDQSAPATSSSNDDDARMVSATGSEPGIANPLPASPSATVSASATPFATKNALYTPVPFSSLPGWGADNVAESWDAFRRSCGVLGGKPGWAAPCAASRTIDAANSAAIRRFFEDNFTVYQIRNVDKSARGVLTGYYEPILKGSRERRPPFVYPVYGVPTDMLFLDARRLPPGARGTPVPARIEGRNVVPLTTVSMSGKTYTLRIGDSMPDIRDKKLRLRRDGADIVPYYSRAEIERGLSRAPVLAYVEDPAMLYAMQLQGAGKVVLPDGKTVIRLAYAEQNGFAFNPPVASAGTKGRKVLVRGVEIDLEEGTVGTQNTQNDIGGAASDDAPQSSLLRGAQDLPAGNADAAPESQLLRGFNLTKSAAAAHPARVSASSASVMPSTKAETPSLASAPPISYTFAASDPSYVFFRTIPDSPAGPIGALGVPLSAGRSAAIDPRTTPLGAPVFINASEGAGSSVTRLLMAQDAGGAIRGAVRADYFFGTGPQAQQQASRMKQPAQMWVLLPKGLRISAKESGVRVRGGPMMPSADCVVSDPDLCVDETR